MTNHSRNLLLAGILGIGATVLAVSAIGGSRKDEKPAGGLGGGEVLDQQIELVLDQAVQRAQQHAGQLGTTLEITRSNPHRGIHILVLIDHGEGMTITLMFDTNVEPMRGKATITRTATGEVVEEVQIDRSMLQQLPEQFGGMIWRRPVPRQSVRRPVRAPAQRWT
jgi:hypothetical protein